MSSDDRVSLREAAERLGVHYMTAYRYVRTGRLPAERIGAQWSVATNDLRLVQATPSRPARSKLAPAERPHRLADRLVAGDEHGAWTIVEGAMSSGADPVRIYTDLLVPALRSIGDRWEHGELSIADEHLASAVAARIIGRLGPRFSRRGRTRGTVVLGAPPGELHALPCAILADLLRQEGFEVADLGADTPAVSFAEAASSADRLVAVLVGVTTPGRDTTVRKLLMALHRAEIGAPVLVGGQGVSGREHALGLRADGWTGPDATSAVETVRALVEVA